MKKSDVQKIITEAVGEVLSELITAPVQKDPATMTPDEKKQALAQSRLKAGITDPNEPIDLVKNEEKVKLKEMPRPAIIYKLADDWESKYQNVNPKWLVSTSRKRWMDGIIDYLKTNGEGDVTTIAKEYFRVPQPMLADYARELIKTGVLVPKHIRGRETDDKPIVPQFMKTPTDDNGDEIPSGPTKLANWGKERGNSAKDAEDLFIGGGFDDDFDNASLQYNVTGTDDSGIEPDVEKTDASHKELSKQEMDTLMQYDDLVQTLTKIKAALKKNSNLKERGGMDELSSETEKDNASEANLRILYKKKKEELKALLAAYKGLITSHRDVKKNLLSIKTGTEDSDIEKEMEEIDNSQMEENLVLKERFQKLANIKK